MKITFAFDPETRTNVILGFLQGTLLFLMHRMIEHEIWPATKGTFVLTWYTVAILVPLALQLITAHLAKQQALKFAVCLTGVLVLLSFYTGRIIPSGTVRDFGFAEIAGQFSSTMVLGWFVMLPFVQTWLARGKRQFPYPDLFEYSWNNMMTLQVAAVFTCIFWSLLGLWAALFLVIQIKFFSELFTKTWFLYLVTATVFGFAISFGRSNKNFVTGQRNTVLLIFKNLLPLAALIVLLFLAALPFKGLKPLWDTKHATTLMLNLQLYVILFVNAVYQDGLTEPPYNPILRKGIKLASLLLPIYSALSAYSLWLRIDQYGWTVERVFAALAIFIVALYAVGYAMATLRRQGSWMGLMSPVNVRVALVVIGLAILVNSPVLDPRGIAARSQMNRLMTGKVSAEKFDYSYFRFELGTIGQRALLRLSKLTDHPQAETIRSHAKAALAKKTRWETRKVTGQTPDELTKNFILFPKEKTFDPSFLQFLFSYRDKKNLSFIHGGSDPIPALAIDLNQDGKDEYIIMFQDAVSSLEIFSFDSHGWRYAGRLLSDSELWISNTHRQTDLESKNYEVVSPSGWSRLRLGGATYSVAEQEPPHPKK